MIVDPPPSSAPSLNVNVPGRLVWQGSTTQTSHSPFTVALVSASGTPVANAQVLVAPALGTATLIDVNGKPQMSLTLTTSNAGTASFDLSFPASGNDDDFSIFTITAANGANSAVVTHALPPTQAPLFTVLNPAGGASLPLVENQPSASGIQLSLTTASKTPLAGVSMRLIHGQTTEAACAGTPLLSNQAGAFTCHLQITGPAGGGSVSFLAGGLASSASIPVGLAAGAPALLKIVSGNWQTAITGQPLPLPLKILALDQFGNPSARGCADLAGERRDARSGVHAVGAGWDGHRVRDDGIHAGRCDGDGEYGYAQRQVFAD